MSRSTASSCVRRAKLRGRDRTQAAPKIGAILPTAYSACDTSWLWDAGIPCINYGPAATYDASGPEETYVAIGEMEECAKILALTAFDICMREKTEGMLCRAPRA